MKLHLTVAALALAFAGGAFAQTTNDINPSPIEAVRSGSWYGQLGQFGSGTGVISIAKFNDPNKVLTGASFATTFAEEQIDFTLPGQQEGSASGSLYGYGSFRIGSGSTQILYSRSSSIINVTGVSNSNPVSVNLPAYTIPAALANTQSQLDNLYGTGTVNAEVYEQFGIYGTVAGLKADNSGTRSATTVADYGSVNHATGGFALAGGNTLSLSFGDVLANTSPTSLNLNLYNLLGSYGLQVVSVTGPTGAPFSLGGITSGGNLTAGSSFAGTVSMAPTALAGLYSGQWLITVADSASGIGAGKNLTNTGVLTLNVSANVTPVPEPESYAMLLAGLSVMGFVARRCQRQS